MDNDRKWYLPSGVCVENILYDYYKRAPKECAAHSWVIDTQDPSLQDCFDPDDWNAMCGEIPPLPDPDSKFVGSMLRFATVCNPSSFLITLPTWNLATIQKRR